MTAEYVAVHLVVQECAKPLIRSQVLDHMQHQARAPGERRPAEVMVALLEPVRAAVRGEVRSNVRSLQARSPDITVALLPYVSRWTVETNAAILSWYIRRWVKNRRVVFHCRGERAIAWARSLSAYVERAAIIADIRGPWPNELLFARGVDSLGTADAGTRNAYHAASDDLLSLLGASHRAVTVSVGMCDWLAALGVARTRLNYIPCCVARVTYDPANRQEMRCRLGLSRSLILAYSGVVNRYQYLTEGLGEFVAMVMRADRDVHFLALTPDTAAMSALLSASGVDRARATVRHVPQADVPGYLSAADAGLILGTPGVLKSVTQPVKFGEYLAAGVPVIATRGARGMDSLIQRYNAGVLVDYDDKRWENDVVEGVVRTLRSDGERLRAGALDLCREHFLWSGYTDELRRVYVDALSQAESKVCCLDTNVERASRVGS